MPRTLLLSVMLIVGVSLTVTAQNFPTPYAVSHTSAPNSITQFDFDVDSTTARIIDTVATHRVYYKDAAASSWAFAPMTLAYKACSTSTYAGSINFTPPSGSLEYYFRSEADSVVASQSPKNITDIWPVPAHYFADLGADPSGDVTGGGQHLDLTGMSMSYSNSKIYAKITNVGGGFPLNQGLTTYFMYSVGIIDPDATDSVAYAMVYVNVPLLLSAGLYKIDPSDSSFTRIGNIQTNISGNALQLNCNIADLLAQPGWSTWPPPSGFILTAPVTATANTSLTLTTNDNGKGGIFVPLSRFLNFNLPNALPLLSNASGAINPIDYTASVQFTDADNNLPALRQVIWGNSPFAMTACGKNYVAGAIFSASLPADTTGNYCYHFRFADGKDSAVTAEQCVFIQRYLPGDADGNSFINIADAIYLINYVFSGGPAPDPFAAGDANCDSIVNIADVVYLVNYIFSGGPAPCASVRRIR